MTNAAQNMSAHLSGAHAAISGYLFQFVGSLGFIADAASEDKSRHVSDSQIDILFRAIRQSGLHLEKHDSDALAVGVNGADETVVVQIKYSVAAKSLAEAELKKICHSVTQQIDRIRLHEGRAVERVVLATNRKLSSASDTQLQKAANRLRRPKGWSDGSWSVLGKLEVRPLGGLQSGYEIIKRFGAQFGADSSESAWGTNELIGSILERISSGKELRLERKDIAKAIVRSEKATFLYAQSSAENSLSEINELCSQIDNSTLENRGFVRSALLQEIDKCAADAAFIAIIGQGGDGKTSCALQWISQRVRSESSLAVRLAGVSHARTVRDTFARDCFRNWIGMKDAIEPWPPSQESIEQVIDRCARAYSIQVSDLDMPTSVGASSGRQPPYFVLLIDGIDELSKAAPDELVKLLRYFANEQRRYNRNKTEGVRATLVVTCRSERELDRLLSLSSMDADSQPLTILTPIFSRAELIELASTFDKEISARLLLSYSSTPIVSVTSSRLLPDRSGFNETIGGGSMIDNVNPARPTIAMALQHPALWSCFTSLSSEVRASILDENLQGLILLASKLLKWAVNKCSIRNSHNGRFERKNIVDHLVLAGEESMKYAAKGRAPNLIWPNTFSFAFRHEVGQNLGDDLASSGVIVFHENSETWWWRHAFVGRLFASAEAVSELKAWARA